MRATIAVMAISIAVLLYTTLYQNDVMMRQQHVIRMFMQNPCIPLTPAQVQKPKQPRSNNG